MSKFKRKRYYVDSAVQFQLARRIVTHWLSFVVVAAGLAACFEFLIENPFQPLSELLSGVLSRHGLLFIALLVLIPVFAYDTIKLSNRFAGPMVRLKRVMQDVGNGSSIAPVKFRDNDFWQDIATDFNRVLDRLEAAEAELRERDESAEQPAEALTA